MSEEGNKRRRLAAGGDAACFAVRPDSPPIAPPTASPAERDPAPSEAAHLLLDRPMTSSADGALAADADVAVPAAGREGSEQGAAVPSHGAAPSLGMHRLRPAQRSGLP